jgi:hypothetical protein
VDAEEIEAYVAEILAEEAANPPRLLETGDDL